MLLVYAVVPAGREHRRQHENHRLSSVTTGPVTVIYEERSDVPGQSRHDVLDFGRVVAGVAAEGATLPVRYGTVVHDVGELRALAEDHAETWGRRLALVDGHVEMVVHLLDDGAPSRTPARTGSGRDYLLSRARAHRHDEETVRDLGEAVAPWSRRSRRLQGTDEVRVACLVPERAVDPFRSALETWVGAHEGRRAWSTGPWPPFSFTEEDEAR